MLHLNVRYHLWLDLLPTEQENLPMRPLSWSTVKSLQDP